jgi:hypothetical protein
MSGIIFNGNDWNIVTKTSDESRTNSTPSNDAELSFTPPAVGTYEFELYLTITCTATLGGLRAGFSIPTNAQLVWGSRVSSATTTVNQFGNNIPTTVIAAASALATQLVYIDCRASHIDASGAFTLQWAQNTTAGANPTVIKAGSFLRWRRVA